MSLNPGVAVALSVLFHPLGTRLIKPLELPLVFFVPLRLGLADRIRRLALVFRNVRGDQ